VVFGVAVEPASAYIGPGAGFAVGTTVLAFLAATFSTMAALLLWPLRTALRMIRSRRAHSKARVKRVVILGLDGMEPSLVEQYMAEGKLPHLSRLRDSGTYAHLGTTAPPLSPVAWSSFLTGCNPGKHRIFDFLSCDRKRYLPQLSSATIKPPRRSLNLGGYKIPLGKPDVQLLRKGKPFWNTLGEHGVFSNIIRVPITFPAEPFHGVLLSGMCVPDLRGSQGTFTYGTTRPEANEYVGGEHIVLHREGEVFRSHLVGPPGVRPQDGSALLCPFELAVTGTDEATLHVNGTRTTLRVGQYTPWIRVAFRAGPGLTVTGICEFLLLSVEPHLQLYVTPIQIDPEKPALPISHPNVFSTYLAKSQGPFATLGLAEDTWGLNAGVLDDTAFEHQCIEADTEREAMFFDALDKVKRGLCVCVFDGTDRIQHMFWRYIDKDHPADNGQGGRQRRDAIEAHYVRMDDLVRRTMDACDDDGSMLMVISDHGFCSFRRGVDLNFWLEQNGYLTLKPEGRGKKYLAGVDWSQTRAFALGLAGIWLNVAGRESQGVVDPEEADNLREEICAKLGQLTDDHSGDAVVSRAFNAPKLYRGPYKGDGPDIVVGYQRGYRVCWEAAVGEPTDKLFHANDRAWSGDHCIDPKLIPGVLFCNRKIEGEDFRLMDIGPTVLELFGTPIPKNMDGRPMSISDASAIGNA
jgi:predicted AlkP superfamily phosphohydrolase/phosphomutase